MATINRRCSIDILSAITDWPIEHSRKICNALSRFSFVKTISDEKVYKLHDEMLWLINEYVDLPITMKNGIRNKIVKNYYNNLIDLNINDLAQQALKAEKLYYLSIYSPGEAIAYFESVVQTAMKSYNFDFCELLFAEIIENNLSKSQFHVFLLNKAEFLLKKYEPFKAKPILDKLLKAFHSNSESIYFTRVLEGLSECSVNGCTLLEGEISEAIALLENGLELCKANSIINRIPVILRQIGFAYELLGKHELAIKHYSEGIEKAKISGDENLLTKLMDSLATLYRWQYKPKEAFELFQKSLSIKEKSGDLYSVGKSYHQMGNSYRDLDDFERAVKYYDLAINSLKDSDNDLELASVYGDYGWLGFLKEDHKMALDYTDKSYEICNIKGFGREQCENYHTYYHVAIKQEGLSSALTYLTKSLEMGRKYSNPFMVLDCLNHLAEAAYIQKEWDKLPPILEELEEYERRGCGFFIFKGRTLIVFGDMHYQIEQYQDALNNWMKGLSIIAKHGKSRSSATTFSDYFYKRKDLIVDAIKKLGLASGNKFKKYWNDNGLYNEYPDVVDTCDQAIGTL